MSDELKRASVDALILDQTVSQSAPLVPEIQLRLAQALTPLWEESERTLSMHGVAPPFWAFAWVGGQALARYILDHPASVRDAHVLDVGCGGGIVAIAAAMAGAARIQAIDIDPVALAMAHVNAAANGVTFETLECDATTLDQTGAARADVILLGDVCYEWEASQNLEAWMDPASAVGVDVLIGDPGRLFLPKERLDRLARYDVETTEELEDNAMKQTGVFAFR